MHQNNNKMALLGRPSHFVPSFSSHFQTQIMLAHSDFEWPTNHHEALYKGYVIHNENERTEEPYGPSTVCTTSDVNVLAKRGCTMYTNAISV